MQRKRGVVMKINLSKNATFIIETLEKNGFECFAVGGCVRDSLLSFEVNDWDFTTSATPDEIIDTFSDYTTIDVGKRFGTICVVIDCENFEITTYRTDGKYSDTRHPDSVCFSKNIKDDLSRRDFTINALAYNDRVGLVDEFDGLTDLKYGVIRCVGEPDVRFSEDALRIMRALRFASTYGFSIEPKTSKSIFSNKDKLNCVASERIIKELSKLIVGPHADFILRRYKEVISEFIPEISVMFNFDQKSLHHNKDLWKHTVSAVKHTPQDEIMRTVMLLHDIGKPMTVSTDEQGHNHFHNHPKLSAEIASTILKRLKYPSAFIGTVRQLIEYHDTRLTPDPKVIKRCLRDIGEDNMRMLLKIQRADILAQSSYKREEKLSTLSKVSEEFERIVNSDECYSLNNLCINGRDILKFGVKNGSDVGVILSKCLDKVIDGTLENSRDELLVFSEHMLKSLEGMR